MTRVLRTRARTRRELGAGEGGGWGGDGSWARTGPARGGLPVLLRVGAITSHEAGTVLNLTQNI